MIRTHFYLTDEQARSIELKSLRERRSKAEIMRDIFDKGLRADEATVKRTAGQALLDLAKLGNELGMTGPTDLSTNHDDYLYGDKE